MNTVSIKETGFAIQYTVTFKKQCFLSYMVDLEWKTVFRDLDGI